MAPTPKDEEKEHFIKATEETEEEEEDDDDDQTSPCKAALVDEDNDETACFDDVADHTRMSTYSENSSRGSTYKEETDNSSRGSTYKEETDTSSRGSTYKEDTGSITLDDDAMTPCGSVEVLPQMRTKCAALSKSVNDIILTCELTGKAASKSVNNVAISGDTTSNITSKSMSSVAVTSRSNSILPGADNGSRDSCRCEANDRLIAQYLHKHKQHQQQHQQQERQQQQPKQQQQQQQQQQQLPEEREPLVCPHVHEFRGCPVPTPHPPYGAQYPHYDNNGNNGFVAVTLQHLNGHILPVRNENDAVFMAIQQQQQQQQQQNRAYGLAYETSQSSDSVICRICHSSGEEKLIAPCKCAGSSRYVHEPCLVTWFKKSVKNECELCRSEVKIKKINHSLTRWRKPEDRPIPLIWFSVFFIGLFLNILSIHVNASEYCKSTACLIFYIVNGFGIILDSAFLYFWFLKCRHYCKKWFALNQDWFIDDLDTPADAAAVEYVRSDGHNPV